MAVNDGTLQAHILFVDRRMVAKPPATVSSLRVQRLFTTSRRQSCAPRGAPLNKRYFDSSC